ncbi:MAG: capsule biosynthesis protein [Campylobacteraceae bacterium]|jgi:capsular polysaccharide transport system permease protein|nr:capsule biosynthesis protein [Campylobacteraceae bacterium]
MSKLSKFIKRPHLFFKDAYLKRTDKVEELAEFTQKTRQSMINAHKAGVWFLSKSFIAIVIIPFTLAVFYYLFFAADRYVSENIISIRQAKESSIAGAGGLAALVGINPSSKEDMLYLKEYIHSLDMLKTLEKELNLREIYSKKKFDFLYRFYNFLSQEDFLKYYQNRVEIIYDDMSGLLKINTEAFTPKDAHDLSILILKHSESFVNELSHAMSRKQFEFAEIEFKKAEERFSRAKETLLAFQNQYGILNPIEYAQSRAGLVWEFEVQLAKKEAELSAITAYLQESAPQVITLKNEINALKAQIEKGVDRVTKKSDNASNTLASEYQTLAIEANFSEELYKLSLQAIEQARIESTKQIKYLSVVQQPSTPESAKYPRKIYNLITLLAVLFLLYGITQLIKATIEDHKY